MTNAIATKTGSALFAGKLLSEVEPERVSWLWPGRIPLGKLTIIDGDPDNGKSALTTDIAARVSTGWGFPDGAKCEAGGVILMNAEDGLADTIRPRLDAAGADVSKVLALATIPEDDGGERLFSIPEDLAMLEMAVEYVEAACVVIDPLMAFLSEKVNAHKDSEIRRALAPLAALAERTGAAVVVVRHLNKATGGSALYRGGGSIGIIGAARSGLLVAPDPEDENRKVLAPMKGNLSKTAPSLTFGLTEAANGSVRLEWGGESNLRATHLLAPQGTEEERSALDEAKDFLRDELKAGPMGAKQIHKGARDAGIADITLRRAKTVLGVRSEKEGDGSWSWVLPKPNPEPPNGQDAQLTRPDQDDRLEHLDNLLKDDRLEHLEDEHLTDSLYSPYISEDDQHAQHAHPNGYGADGAPSDDGQNSTAAEGLTDRGTGSRSPNTPFAGETSSPRPGEVLEAIPWVRHPEGVPSGEPPEARRENRRAVA